MADAEPTPEPDEEPDDDAESPDSQDAINERYEAENTRLTKLLQRHADVLGEHFDSVRIIATVNRGDGMYGRCSRGAGNWFAQYGSVREWLLREDQSARNQAD